MNDVVRRLLVMKRSFFKTKNKNERKTFLFWLEINETRNDSQCFLAVSEDFLSLDELVIRLQMVFPECVLENVCCQEVYETCMIVKGIGQDVLKACAECRKNLI